VAPVFACHDRVKEFTVTLVAVTTGTIGGFTMVVTYKNEVASPALFIAVTPTL
jgi:hypothetical protein